MTCVMFVRNRRPQRYEASKPNREGRAASSSSCDEMKLVAESVLAFPPTSSRYDLLIVNQNKKNQTIVWFFYILVGPYVTTIEDGSDIG